jgi:hypothetical protein
MTEYNYPKEKPDEGEQVLVDLGGEGEFFVGEEFRWWLCYFFHDDGFFTTSEKGHEFEIPLDTGEEFVWYRLSHYILKQKEDAEYIERFGVDYDGI